MDYETGRARMDLVASAADAVARASVSAGASVGGVVPELIDACLDAGGYTMRRGCTSGGAEASSASDGPRPAGAYRNSLSPWALRRADDVGGWFVRDGSFYWQYITKDGREYVLQRVEVPGASTRLAAANDEVWLVFPAPRDAHSPVARAWLANAAEDGDHVNIRLYRTDGYGRLTDYRHAFLTLGIGGARITHGR